MLIEIVTGGADSMRTSLQKYIVEYIMLVTFVAPPPLDIFICSCECKIVNKVNIIQYLVLNCEEQLQNVIYSSVV